MLVKRAYKFRLCPTKEQMALMAKYTGQCRFVWNWFRVQREDWYQSGVSEISPADRDPSVNPNHYVSQANQLPALKKHFPWLCETPSHVLQQILKDLDRAYKNFFKGIAAYPQFRKKGQKSSFRFPDGFRLEGNRLKLPKLESIKIRLSRKVKGKVKNVTVSKRGNHWYASLQVEEELVLPKAKETPIGLDLGVTDLIATSSGERTKPVDFSKLREKQLELQRSLSRKRKGSSNWRKAKQKLSQIHVRIADKRKDYLNKLSTRLCKNHAVIVVEDLNVRHMSSTAKGNIENPGKNVKAKSGLNRSILSQGWHEFLRQLEYKSSWRMGKVVKVNPKHTSQRCNVCGHTQKENRKGKHFACISCGQKEDADINAAKNILVAGQAMSACGEIRPVAA